LIGASAVLRAIAIILAIITDTIAAITRHYTSAAILGTTATLFSCAGGTDTIATIIVIHAFA
jgi:hypothetical protein